MGNGKPDVLALFRRVATEVTKKDLAEVSPSSAIAHLDIDSVAIMEIVGCIEDELGIVIPNESLSKITTLGDLVREVESRLAA